MIPKFCLVILLGICAIGCDDEYDNLGCEEGYILQYGGDGTTFCAEGYAEDNLKEYVSGESYFHKEYGLITFTNGIWVNKHKQVIEP